MSTYTPIATQTLSSAASSVTFSSIPQGYTDLIIVMNRKQNLAGAYHIGFRYNGDTGSNYSDTSMTGTGSSAVSGRNSNIAQARVGYGDTGWGNTIVHIQNYSNSTTYKTTLSRNNNPGADVAAIATLWRNTSPITSIEIISQPSSTLEAGSTFSIYGIASGDVTAKASGGIVTTSGGYAYHTFTTSGGFTPYTNLTVDYLVVAGGGGAAAGGGGAGGLRSTVTATGGGGSLETALSLTAGITYPAVVGAGGAGINAYGSIQGYNGSNSIFASVISTGGGGGGSSSYVGNGGSGGGASYSSGSVPYGLGIANQGFNGGQDIYDGAPYPGAGGGGAGQVGYNPPNGSNGGNGGNGVQITALATPTSTGANSGYYAGGGGGGVYGASSTATGGLGGGGNASAGSGTVNTGGGGAGTSNGGVGGAGGSGIVIIRYAL